MGWVEDAAYEVPGVEPQSLPPPPLHLPPPDQDRGLPAQGHPGDIRIKTIKILNGKQFSEHFLDPCSKF